MCGLPGEGGKEKGRRRERHLKKQTKMSILIHDFEKTDAENKKGY